MTIPTARWDQKRNEARIECRQCGFGFGRLSADRRHPAFTPGLHVIVDTTLQRVDVICPRCGQRRRMAELKGRDLGS